MYTPDVNGDGDDGGDEECGGVLLGDDDCDGRGGDGVDTLRRWVVVWEQSPLTNLSVIAFQYV